jgi:hypothetical protein
MALVGAAASPPLSLTTPDGCLSPVAVRKTLA